MELERHGEAGKALIFHEVPLSTLTFRNSEDEQ